ncbi:MAG: glutamine--fructose-6-phosphate transaminase (isomerizing) [Marinilabiliales bacterium]|nr:MAG: glutamine--fructose-6-phosphate transaminase (isomerizing) [Marinilabiliales bacterium]
MCGIVGYTGHRQAYPVLMDGLAKLEYRGYDSAGISLFGKKPTVFKCSGKIKDLEDYIAGADVTATTGMGHTRWATHGEPNDINAHPHTSQDGHFVIIHNGIIENYDLLKNKLEKRGYAFRSETDTEVLANLIEYIYLKGKVPAEVAVRLALTKVLGTYGLVVMCTDEPGQLIAARCSSPLVIGIGEGEYFIASDASPIAGYTKSVIYLNDNDVAIIRSNELTLKTVRADEPKMKLQSINIDTNDYDKGGYEHYMLKEIFEQPRSITDTFRGRLVPDQSDIKLGGLHSVIDRLQESARLVIVACGTSWHAALIGEYLLEDLARIPVEVEYASEFRYRNPVLGPDDIVVAISQSGETADTLAAVRMAREAGAMVLGICNVTGSGLSRETDAGVYTHAGIEIGVASTKAFTAQVTVLTMIALLLGRKRGHIDEDQYRSLIGEMHSIPSKINRILEQSSKISDIAKRFSDIPSMLYIGRGYCFPVALEGALKLKEISYIHAEGYPAAEMKHGPIALIDEKMPVVVVGVKDKYYEKIVSNVQEIKARKGIVIAVVNEGDEQISSVADHIMEVPESNIIFSALLSVIPLQLFAYHIAVERGCDVDQPRNLAKSVTVE